jgi:FKBP-type peptidyl-prolyl cis-trans isomerase
LPIDYLIIKFISSQLLKYTFNLYRKTIMQIKSLFITMVAGSLILASCNTFKSSKVELKTIADSVAYAIGSDMANAVVKQFPNYPGGKDLDKKIILAAFTEIINGKESVIPAEKVPVITQSYFMKMQAVEGAANIEAGKKFLDDNGKRTGVKTTASGLQYEILKDASGPKPLATDTVVVNYHGTTIEGTVFDSSVDRKQPATFVVNQVIPGWIEVLQMMSVGSKWKVYIPSALGYGERPPQGSNIKPNSVLVFEVELLEIKK